MYFVDFMQKKETKTQRNATIVTLTEKRIYLYRKMMNEIYIYKPISNFKINLSILKNQNFVSEIFLKIKNFFIQQIQKKIIIIIRTW